MKGYGDRAQFSTTLTRLSEDPPWRDQADSCASQWPCHDTNPGAPIFDRTLCYHSFPQNNVLKHLRGLLYVIETSIT